MLHTGCFIRNEYLTLKLSKAEINMDQQVVKWHKTSLQGLVGDAIKSGLTAEQSRHHHPTQVRTLHSLK